MKNRLIVCIILLVLVLFILNISFVSSTFVCGFVSDSDKFSADWIEVKVYYAENELDFTNCQVSPENKFCCDLENISSVNFSVGKKVFAEISDLKTGVSGGPVFLYLTGEGYDLFPDMKLRETISLNISDNQIILNSSSFPLEFFSDNSFNNWSYKVSSSGESFERSLCESCNYSEFSIPLSKGKNEIYLTSNKTNHIDKSLVIYNLDYLEMGINIFCDGCKIKKNFWYVPSYKEITINSYLNSSHNISGDFLLYFPREWVLINSSNFADFSLTHKAIVEKIQNESFFSSNYTFKTPKKLIKQDYFISQKINGNSNLFKIRSFKFKFLPFYQKNNLEENYPIKILSQSSSGKEPIVLDFKKEGLETIAIFPKSDIKYSYSYIEFKKDIKKTNPEIKFNILSTLSEDEIDKIFLIFKVEKGKSIEVLYKDVPLQLAYHNEDNNYRYYSAYIYEKSPFIIKMR